MLGERASLVCVVRKLGNYTVSWIYKPTNMPERVMVLTSGQEVFSSDQRWEIKVSRQIFRQILKVDLVVLLCCVLQNVHIPSNHQ